MVLLKDPIIMIKDDDQNYEKLENTEQNQN